MISIRKGAERGHFNHGWLNTYHSFSFGDYFDENHMGFRTLRVINEDVIEAGQGFPTHGHRDMEIVTYILEGELAHQDSLGNRETIKTGEFQRMSAGTGIRHSEFNASSKERCHLLQIWILPEKKDLTPGYEQKSFPQLSQSENLRLAVSQQAERGSLLIHQDAKIYTGNLTQKEKLTVPLNSGRHAWVQMVKGTLDLNGKELNAGDGAAISAEKELRLEGIKDCEFLLFDLN